MPNKTDPTELLQINTPVIDIQDLEHLATSDTRISNKGLRVEPKMDSDDVRDFAREDEDALLALEELEKTIRSLMPS